MQGGNKENITSEEPVVTAHVAAANTNNGATEEIGSLGKFKDVNALLSSYNSLQSEFTKRCKRLKQLEGENAKLKEQSQKTFENACGTTVPEKPENDGFTAHVVAENVASAKNGVPENAQNDACVPVDEIPTELLYERVVKSPEVASKIVKEYLSGVLSSKPKTVLISDNYGGSALMPPKKPASFSEAGKMAESLLRKK